MKERKDKIGKGTFTKGNQKIDITLPFVSFKEDNIYIYYCPALDLTGYGETEEDAEKSIKIVLGEFFDYSLTKKTLHSELERLGWILKSKKKFIPPDILSVANTNESFKEIVNHKDYRTHRVNIPIPAFC